MGAEFKVPFLRHELQKARLIAKIMSQSNRSEGYVPIKIAPVFIEECFGQSVGDDVLKNALGHFEEVEFEDIIEFCNSNEAKV
ncbi:hypothetical protein JTB14_011744 [Gonioctena quinquepunctata]|nr:hypothetical protein JTB14_011744 [Gonioctena quinquepunctata]